MSEGLKHHHQFYEDHAKYYYDKDKHCRIKKVIIRCMICGAERHEFYECYEPPPKHKTPKWLKNKKNNGPGKT